MGSQLNLVLKRKPTSERCILSHDLNNSLYVILVRCELQLQCLDLQSEAAAHARLIQEAARDMAHRIAGTPCPFCRAVHIGEFQGEEGRVKS
jgi:hypothetical protein